MKTHLTWIAAAALAGTLLISGPAPAAQVAVQQMVMGEVTSVSASTITIDGRQFIVLAGSPAAQQLAQIAPGQKVQVVLDRPSTDPTAHVLAVSVQSP